MGNELDGMFSTFLCVVQHVFYYVCSKNSMNYLAPMHIMRTNKMNENQWTNSNKSNAPSIFDHINNGKFNKTKTTYIYNSKNMKNVAFLRFKNHVYMCAVPANVNTLHRHAHLPPLIFWYIAKSNSGLGWNFVTLCVRSDLLILLFHLCVHFFLLFIILSSVLPFANTENAFITWNICVIRKKEKNSHFLTL